MPTTLAPDTVPLAEQPQRQQRLPGLGLDQHERAISAAEAAKMPSVRPDVQPCSLVPTSRTPAARGRRSTVNAPARSKRRPSPANRLSPSSRGAERDHDIAIGTLMKKIHSQPASVGQDAARSTPAAPPRPDTAPQMPSALLRSAPSVKVVVRIESAAGAMIAAPRPCSARNADQRAVGRRQAGAPATPAANTPARHEHPPTTEQVGRSAAEQEEAAEREGVRARDPLQALRPRSRGRPGSTAARRSRSRRRAR